MSTRWGAIERAVGVDIMVMGGAIERAVGVDVMVMGGAIERAVGFLCYGHVWGFERAVGVDVMVMCVGFRTGCRD